MHAFEWFNQLSIIKSSITFIIHSIILMLISSIRIKCFTQTAIPCFWPFFCLSLYTRRLFDGLFLGHLVSTRETEMGTRCLIESGGLHSSIRARWRSLIGPLTGSTSWKFVAGLTTGIKEFWYQRWQNGVVFFLKSKLYWCYLLPNFVLLSSPVLKP